MAAGFISGSHLFYAAAMGRPASTNKLSASQAAYVAGIIDGEGTITLTATHAGENRRLVISVASTERQLLEYLKRVIGVGKITAKRTYSSRHTPSHAYALTSRQALALMRQIVPYLRTYKRRRAELLLRDYLIMTPRNGKYSPALRIARTAFEHELLSIRPVK
jgi:LAGLIDADG endonuclease